MKLVFKILLALLIEGSLLPFCLSQRQQYQNRYRGQWRRLDNGRNRNRGRRPHQRFDKSSQFTNQNVNDWFTSLFSNGGSYQWSNNGNNFPFYSSYSSSSSIRSTISSSISSGGNRNFTSNNDEQKLTTTAQPHARPWRGQGSFTGDLRLQCFNRRCSKGIVQIYNREQKTWGTICADRWTKRESDVVCRYLQFPRGSVRALKLRKKKLNSEAKKLQIAFRQLNCDEETENLIECKGQAITRERRCAVPYYAGVVCRGRKEEFSVTPSCSPTQVLCENRQKCIERTYECDEMSDCPWGTDEAHCEEEETNPCSSDQFNCGTDDGRCIPKTYKCDGDRDCRDGRDEEDCDDHLSHFRSLPNKKLRIASSPYNSGWRNVSPLMCAKFCREASFQCVAFDYNEKIRECDLSSRGRKEVGLEFDRDYTHYEMSVDEDCTEFVCGDECLPSSVVCNGNKDCPNGLDEENCDDDDEDLPWELRLTGGFTPMDGRIEVRKDSGSFGLICDVGWGIEEGNVACRELGYRYGAAAVLPGLTSPKTRRRVILSGVSCRGDESALRECSHDPWGRPNCPDNQHKAGVICRRNEPSTTTTPSTRFTTTTRETTPATPPVVTVPTNSGRQPECGVKPSVIRSRIVNGNKAAPHEWPWQVAIWIQTRQLVCGATLISECWVLTAAHCFTRQFPLRAYVIRLGDHRSRQHDGTEQEFSIKRLIPNNYNSVSHDNDVALIEKLKSYFVKSHSYTSASLKPDWCNQFPQSRTRQNIQPTVSKHALLNISVMQLLPKNGRCAIFNDYVQPACLPTGPEQFQPGKECRIVGWGQIQFDGPVPFENTLRHATVPLLSRFNCMRRTVYGSSITQNMFCAGYLRGGVDTCQGDSGGPLLCKEEDRYYVWGVVSWGNGCAEPKAPGVYAKVFNYVGWIRRTTGITSS